VRVFEVSRCFRREGSGLAQPQRLGALAYGFAAPEQWGVPARWVDFFDARGEIEALFAPLVPEFRPTGCPGLYPGKSAEVLGGGTAVGWVGELHPRIKQKYDIPGTAVAFELDLETVLARPLPAYQEVSKFPLVRRDLSYVFDREISVQAVLDGLNAGKSAIVEDVSVFDVYYGKGIEEGKKGLAFRVLLQDTQKTLTDAEVDAAVAGLREVLEKQYRAKLRQ
ncbi:MAG: phenylalanine--tRNA ligase subunit beta, partial [Burkholderiales bacterium]